jgi:hypothetical protein
MQKTLAKVHGPFRIGRRSMWPSISKSRISVGWWSGGVRTCKKAREGNVERTNNNDNDEKHNADPRYLFTVAEAERLTGISQQKVSKWRTHLSGDLDAYRDLLRGPSYRKAARFIGLARERLGAGKPRSQQIER